SINGLINNEDYEVRVQAVCAEDNLSDWSEILIATATNSSIDSYLLNSIALYPNPANDVVNVECTMNNVQLEGIEVIDVYGKIITTVGTRFIASAQSPASAPIQINVSSLANGMYFVRVTTDEGVATKTFIKK
ncbi:MAG: T9SS type A sorting domain-containing protein, partial [Bacteroidales bacterium]|nr:T9SS type A sorting domain-containing protein [Bacteroidales bacterium]